MSGHCLQQNYLIIPASRARAGVDGTCIEYSVMAEVTLLGDVVHQEGSYCTSVIGAGNRTISLLPSCVPNLRLDCLSINL